jgi:2-keto-4-pentenoate hydratase
MADALQELAQRILADDAGRFVGEPLTLTTAQAYAVQTEVARLREQRGERIIGYKVGCTSQPIREQLGVQEPIFGRLFDTGCHPSGVRLSATRYANPAVEGELAVRLRADLPGGAAVSAEACREAIEAVFPVIELHHFVLPAAWPRGMWLIASGGMHAGFVRAETAARSSGLERFARTLSVRINEFMVGAVEDASSLTDAIESLRWLSGRLAQFGLQLCKGQVILTGSPMQLFPIAPDSRIVVEAPPLGASCVEIHS